MCVCMCVCVIVIGMHVSCVYVYTQKPHTLSRHYNMCLHWESGITVIVDMMERGRRGGVTLTVHPATSTAESFRSSTFTVILSVGQYALHCSLQPEREY